MLVSTAHSPFERSRLRYAILGLTDPLSLSDYEANGGWKGLRAALGQQAGVEVLGRLREQGVRVGLLRPITLWPFPERFVRALDGQAKAFVVETTKGRVRARNLVNCAGLQSDRVARMAGLRQGNAVRSSRAKPSRYLR